MRKIIQTRQFKRDYKKVSCSGRYSVHDFKLVIEQLLKDKQLSEKNRDHALSGDWIGYRECHIKPDLLLVYQKKDDELILVRMGSHSELFS